MGKSLKVKLNKVTKGYVVKQEMIEDRPDPKHPGNTVKVKIRREVSRLFHAISAAETYLDLCKKQWPDGDFYIHERTGVDGLTHQPT